MLKRRAVVVLSMHRSGTSALTGMLGLLGCALPATLVPANKTNLAGHWESQPICDFDDALFAAAGTHWLDWGPLDPKFRQSAVWPEMIDRARSLLRSEFGVAPLLAIKDPRMCRLADLWLEALDGEGVEPAVVLVLRHPFEVSSSLAVGGYPVDEGYGKILWLRHLLSSEAATRGRCRTVVTFDMLMTNWRGLAEKLSTDLEIDWPHRAESVAEKVELFLSPNLRHHSVIDRDSARSPLRSWVAEVYAILSCWAEQGEDSGDYPALDDLASAFDAAAPVFAQSLSLYAETRKEADGLRAELSTVLQGREEAVVARDAAWALNQMMAGELDAARRLIDDQVSADRVRLDCENDAHQEAARLRHELAFAQSQCIQREEQLSQVEAEAAAERAELGGLRGALTDARGEITRLAARLVDADEWVFRLAGEREAAAAAVRRMEAVSARKTQSAARKLAQERGDFQRALSVADGRAAAAEHSRSGAEARTAAAEQERETARANHERLAQRLTEARADWNGQTAERYQEIAILTSLLLAREDKAVALTRAADRAQLQVEAAERARLEAVACVAAAEQDRDAAWSDRIAAALSNLPKWWSLVARSVRERWEEERLRDQRLFDADGYRAANPDVAAAGVSPVRHYLRFGLQERRTGFR